MPLVRYWSSFLTMAITCGVLYFFPRFKGSRHFHQFMRDLDPSKYYDQCELRGAVEDVQKEGSMFCFHPHGILCCGFSFNGAWSKPFFDVAGDDTWFMIDKSLREDNCFFKQVCDLHGGCETLNKKSIQKALGTNRNVAFLPGGFEDATMMEYGKNSTVIAKRQGFIKYGLQNGTRVHPVYTFGETDTFYTFTGLQKLRLWISSKGIPAVAFIGFPFFPLFPRTDAKVLTYVGKPIQLPKIEEPTKEDVKKWHTTYCEALIKLFEDNKKEAGLPSSAKLDIL